MLGVVTRTSCEATSARLVDGESERAHSTAEAGELDPGGPRRGRGRVVCWSEGENDAGATVPRKRLNKTSSDSGPGEEGTGVGLPQLGPPHRHGSIAFGVPAHSE